MLFHSSYEGSSKGEAERNLSFCDLRITWSRCICEEVCLTFSCHTSSPRCRPCDCVAVAVEQGIYQMTLTIFSVCHHHGVLYLLFAINERKSKHPWCHEDMLCGVSSILSFTLSGSYEFSRIFILFFFIQCNWTQTNLLDLQRWWKSIIKVVHAACSAIGYHNRQHTCHYLSVHEWVLRAVVDGTVVNNLNV